MGMKIRRRQVFVSRYRPNTGRQAPIALPVFITGVTMVTDVIATRATWTRHVFQRMVVADDPLTHIAE
jgi:hypothetical protein